MLQNYYSRNIQIYSNNNSFVFSVIILFVFLDFYMQKHRIFSHWQWKVSIKFRICSSCHIWSNYSSRCRDSYRKRRFSYCKWHSFSISQLICALPISSVYHRNTDILVDETFDSFFIWMPCILWLKSWLCNRYHPLRIFRCADKPEQRFVEKEKGRKR